MTVGILSFGAPAQSAAGWTPFRLGAGGWIHDGDIMSDGTQVIQTDTYNAYLWNSAAAEPGPSFGTGMWQQLITLANCPTLLTDLFTIQQSAGGGQGCYAIRVAPSNTSIFYMSYMGRILKSTDKGATWSITNYTFVSYQDMPANDGQNAGAFSFGRRMAIHPTDPNTVLLGTYAGVFLTTDGGATWTKKTTITAPTQSGCMVEFDPVTPSIAYAGSYDKGIWKSTDTGATWTKLTTTGAPSTIRRIHVDHSANLWVVDNSGLTAVTGTTGLYKFNGTSWTNVQMTGVPGWDVGLHSAYTDPNNASTVIVTSQKSTLARSTNGGTSWSGGDSGGNGTPHGPLSTTGLVANDIPYLAIENLDTIGNLIIDNTGKVWLFQGVGVWNTTLPASLSTAWYLTSQSAGVEQLITNCIVSNPSSGRIIVSNYDRAVFSVSNPKIYQSSYTPPTFANPPGSTTSDYAGSNPSIMFAWVSDRTLGSSFYKSTDAGATWAVVGSGGTAPYQGGDGHGTLAVSTSANLMWLHFGTGNPWYSTDGGVTWTNIASYFSTNFGFSPTGNDSYIVADKVTANVFYLIHGTGTYRSTDGGATWASRGGNPQTVAAGGSGLGSVFRAVPGNAGHLLFTTGQNYNNNHPQPYSIAFSQDGGQTWANLNSNIKEPWLVGTGKQVGSYPSIGFVGWYKVGGIDTRGIWISDDKGATFRSIGDWTTYGTWDINLVWLEGSQTIAGEWYLALSQSGAARYGT